VRTRAGCDSCVTPVFWIKPPPVSTTIRPTKWSSVSALATAISSFGPRHPKRRRATKGTWCSNSQLWLSHQQRGRVLIRRVPPDIPPQRIPRLHQSRRLRARNPVHRAERRPQRHQHQHRHFHPLLLLLRQDQARASCPHLLLSGRPEKESRRQIPTQRPKVSQRNARRNLNRVAHKIFWIGSSGS